MAELQRWKKPYDTGRGQEGPRVVDGEYIPPENEIYDDIRRMFDNILSDVGVPRNFIVPDPEPEIIDVTTVEGDD